MQIKVSLVALATIATVAAQAGTVYNNIPSTLDPNYVSQGFEATSTYELGDRVGLAGTDRLLSSATVTMSDWAIHSDYTGIGDATGFDHALTMNIYAAGPGDSVGALLGTKTQTFHMLWRPENNPGDNSYWVGPDNNHYHGIAFNCTFDLSTLGLTVPNTIIYGLAYNTADYGANPTHASGPYNSLNYALGGTTTVGTDVDPDEAYLNSTWAGAYTDNGAGGLGTFRRDTGWTGFAPMVQFNAVPEPASMAVLGMGAIAFLRRRKTAKK